MPPNKDRGALGRGRAGIETARAVFELGQMMLGPRMRRGGAPAPVDDGGTAELAAPALTPAPAMTPLAAAGPVVAPAPATVAADPAGPTAARPVAHRLDRRPISWNWVALLGLTSALGLASMTVANALSRAGRPHAEPLFWLGVLLILLPVTARLLARGSSRGERVLLVTGLGMVLYLAKVLHDPFTFTYGDEFLHLRNAEDILRQGGLFPRNSILPVSIYYPGLETLTVGLAQLSGLSLFGAGIVVIGAARMLLMLGLFLLFERLAGSSRLGALAALVYVASPNFLFFSAQFSYQSLSLPLAVLVLVAVARRSRADSASDQFGWLIVAMLTITAIVMTHHLTAYGVVLLLIALSVVAVLGAGRRREACWGLAAFAIVAVVVWLLQVAPATGEYLTSIFRRTLEGVSTTVGGTSAPRRLFRSQSGEEAELWERAVGLASVGLITLVLPFGLVRAWRRRRRSALLIVMAFAAALYLAILPLRLVPNAWETANRASDFLYIGIAVIVALAGLHEARRHGRVWVRRVGALLFIGVITVGGAVAGWPPNARLSQPYVAMIGGREVTPQGSALARWSLAQLGPSQRFFADDSNGRYLMTQGRQLPLVGRDGLSRAVLEDFRLSPDLAELMRDIGVTYVAVDRRAISTDNIVGYFFAPTGPEVGSRGTLAPDRVNNLDDPSDDRIFDSGDIVVYDVRRLDP